MLLTRLRILTAVYDGFVLGSSRGVWSSIVCGVYRTNANKVPSRGSTGEIVLDYIRWANPINVSASALRLVNMRGD
jgi:hypothetical protein